MTTKLVPISNDNWREVVKLQLEEDQSRFVAPNWYSIIEAIFDEGDWESMAIINGDGQIIGYTMYEANTAKRLGYICRFMLDKHHQRKGHGRAAMQIIIDDLRARDNVDVIKISFVPANVAARTLYESLGFVDKGEVEDGEIVLEMSAL